MDLDSKSDNNSKIPNLKISVSSDEIRYSDNSPFQMKQITMDNIVEPDEKYPYPCLCNKDDECVCGCRLITEETILEVYQSLGLTSYEDSLEKGYRLNSLHVWGTGSLSTQDLFSYLLEYSPTNIEWINDDSCNVVFDQESAALRALLGLSEPCLPDTIDRFTRSKSQGSGSDEGELDSQSDIMQGSSRPDGKWRKAFALPEKVEILYLRYANKRLQQLPFLMPTFAEDVKRRGAEKHSAYYLKHGNPNYGGMVGIISKSRRNRLRSKRSGPDSDIREVKTPRDPGLVVYDDLYSDSDTEEPSAYLDDHDDRAAGAKYAREDSVKEAMNSRRMLTSLRMVADEEEYKRKIPMRARVGADRYSNVHSRLSTDIRDPTRSGAVSLADRLGPRVRTDLRQKIARTDDRKELRRRYSSSESSD